MKKTTISVAIAGLALWAMLFSGTAVAVEPVEIYTSTSETHDCTTGACRYYPTAKVAVSVSNNSDVKVDVVESTGSKNLDKRVQRLVAGAIDPSISKGESYSDVPVKVTYVGLGGCIQQGGRNSIVDPAVLCSPVGRVTFGPGQGD